MKVTNSTSRVRTSFDPELELPKLHRWFAENPHPSRLTLQLYVRELNSLASRQSRKLLEVHNLCYWFKNARAAYKRAEIRVKKNNDPNQPQQQQPHQSSSEVRSIKSHSEDVTSWLNPSQGLKLTSSNSSPILSNSNEEILFQRSLPRASPNLNKRTYYPRAQLMKSSSEELPKRKSAGDVDLCTFKSKDGIGGSINSMSNVHKCFNQQPVCGFTDADTSSSDNSAESPSRTESTSPSSTASLPALGTTSSNQQYLQLKPQQSEVAANLNNLDLANAVNYLLNTATNFTAAAAAVASSSLPPSGPVFQGPPSSAAINLAATLFNSNLINVSNRIGADQSAATIAAALNSQQAAAAAAAAAAAMTNPAVLVEPPIRQLFTAFNPSSYQFALGMLDNKVLDSNILNKMIFPTSACASDPTSRHSSFGHSLSNNNRQHFIRQYNSNINLDSINNNNLSRSDININDGDNNHRYHQQHRHHKSKLSNPKADDL